MTAPLIVAGVDVGGARKGFHAVALQGGAYLAQFASPVAAEVAAWCEARGARCVGVDAPCQWSSGRARPCERELAKERISSFITPTRERAVQNTSGFYGWMFSGMELYAQLAAHYALFGGQPDALERPLCFETFPQAVACHLAGTMVSAKKKCTNRREVLLRAGLDIGALKNIDLVDAALCALAAQHLALGTFKVYGEPVGGLIVVPRGTLAD